ncbi:MAG: alpha/beta fold hydrolase [Nocardioides sp.]|nr:alpha/beta fold hydrolase [Nocardioides sp.]
MTVSEELVAPLTTGVDLCYQTFGDPDGDPLLLVMGLGGPMNWWPTAFCEDLAERGFHVVRYDNRDTGRSTVLTERVGRSTLVRAFLGRRVRVPYGIPHFAADAAALMDHLGWDAAHVAGVSMGGMIAQTLAVEHPARVRSLTSIMSSTGRKTVGWQDPRLIPVLMAPRKEGREAYVEGSVRMAALIGSPGYREPEEVTRARGAETWERGVHNAGVLRHMLAVITQPDRTQRLRAQRAPTLVVHGLADRMVHVSGGRATAAAVPGAELLTIDAMGHDLPTGLFDTFASGIRRTADRAVSGP